MWKTAWDITSANSGANHRKRGVRDTPRRFIQALFDATSVYDGDPKLLKAFPTECPGEPGCRLSQVIFQWIGEDFFADKDICSNVLEP